MAPRSRATLASIPLKPGTGPLVLALAALACFVVAAWGFDWRAGVAVLGVCLFVAEWRVSPDPPDDGEKR